jgi:nucleotide-binding universal stress UspA family protein
MSDSIEGAIARIVVGVDLSDTGDHALREAMKLCKWLPGCELHVAHVIHAERSLHDADQIERLASVLNERMTELRERVTRVCGPLQGETPFSQETVFHVRLGNPADALHQVAVDCDADLIVVGTHARRGLEKLLLGSVAEALVRMAHVPVLIARPKDFSELTPSERPEPTRPGDDLRSTGLSDRLHLEFVPRNTHISGLL